MMRMFVAIDLPAGVRDRAEEIQRALRPAAKGLKWVSAHNLHLTVKFLGEVEADQLAALQYELEGCARGCPPFSLEVEGLGAFPNLRRPRVVWLGVKGQVDLLQQLVKRVDKSLRPLGFEPEKGRFTAHLTLGRARQPVPAPELEKALLAGRTVQVGPLSVGELRLMRSSLGGPEPVYEVVSRHALSLRNAFVATTEIQETEVSSHGQA